MNNRVFTPVSAQYEEVRLTRLEVEIGAYHGTQLRIESLERGYKDKYGFKEEPWGTHIESSCSEIAVAKLLNLYWEPRINTFSDPDIGDRIQVRWRSREDAEMIVRQNAKDHHYYVHVTGKAPVYHVHGWLMAIECKHDPWKQDPDERGWAWFVPARYLFPMIDLKGILKGYK